MIKTKNPLLTDIPKETPLNVFNSGSDNASLFQQVRGPIELVFALGARGSALRGKESSV